MKQAFLLLIAAVALTGIIWSFTAGAPGGNSINLNMHSEFFTNAKAGEHIAAQLYTADSNLQELPCAGTSSVDLPGKLQPEPGKAQPAKQGTARLTGAHPSSSYLQYKDRP